MTHIIKPKSLNVSHFITLREINTGHANNFSDLLRGQSSIKVITGSKKNLLKKYISGDLRKKQGEDENTLVLREIFKPILDTTEEILNKFIPFIKKYIHQGGLLHPTINRFLDCFQSLGIIIPSSSLLWYTVLDISLDKQQITFTDYAEIQGFCFFNELSNNPGNPRKIESRITPFLKGETSIVAKYKPMKNWRISKITSTRIEYTLEFCQYLNQTPEFFPYKKQEIIRGISPASPNENGEIPEHIKNEKAFLQNLKSNIYKAWAFFITLLKKIMLCLCCFFTQKKDNKNARSEQYNSTFFSLKSGKNCSKNSARAKQNQEHQTISAQIRPAAA